MFPRRVEWAIAGGLAGWAAVRLTGADRLRCVEMCTVPLLSFTPQATAAAWATALLLRNRGASAVAAAAGATLTAATAPRTLPRRQASATGPTLRVLTTNLRLGQAEAGPLVELVSRTGAAVLVVQELTDDSAARLRRAGLGAVLPYSVIRTAADRARGGGIYACYPLRDGLDAMPVSPDQPAARLDLPSGRSVQLVCVHLRPPMPPWSGAAIARWRDELSMLPSPGDTPMILAGDFNSTFDHKQFRRLLHRGYLDAAGQVGNGLAPTWGPEPHGRPGLLVIDHVLVDTRCTVHATSVHRVPGSDHRALYAEIRLPR